MITNVGTVFGVDSDSRFVSTLVARDRSGVERGVLLRFVKGL